MNTEDHKTPSETKDNYKEVLKKLKKEAYKNILENTEIKLKAQAMLVIAYSLIGHGIFIKTEKQVEEISELLQKILDEIESPQDTEKKTASKNAQELLLYLEARQNLHSKIDRMPDRKNKERTLLQKELDQIDVTREEELSASNTESLPNLTRQLNELIENSTLAKLLNQQEKELQHTLTRLEKDSPLKTYGNEILKQIQSIRSGVFIKPLASGRIQEHVLLQSLMLANSAIESTITNPTDVDEFNKKAMACARQATRIVPGQEIAPNKKIRGLLLGIAGILLIIASVSVAVATFALATPLSIAGIHLGISFISTGIAAGALNTTFGLKFFKDNRASKTMKIKESLEKISTTAQNIVKESSSNKGE